MYIKNDSVNDITMRWSDTVIGLRNKSNTKTDVFKVSEILEINNILQFYVLSGYLSIDGMWVPHIIKTCDYKIIPRPDPGLKNVLDKYCVNIYRHTTTNTKKGFRLNEFRIVSEGVHGAVSSKPNLAEISYNCYNPIFYTKDDLINRLLNKNNNITSGALSSTVCLVFTEKLKTPAIFRGFSCIGYLDTSKNKVVIPNRLKIFCDEITELGFNNIIYSN